MRENNSSAVAGSEEKQRSSSCAALPLEVENDQEELEDESAEQAFLLTTATDSLSGSQRSSGSSGGRRRTEGGGFSAGPKLRVLSSSSSNQYHHHHNNYSSSSSSCWNCSFRSLALGALVVGVMLWVLPAVLWSSNSSSAGTLTTSWGETTTTEDDDTFPPSSSSIHHDTDNNSHPPPLGENLSPASPAAKEPGMSPPTPPPTTTDNNPDHPSRTPPVVTPSPRVAPPPPPVQAAATTTDAPILEVATPPAEPLPPVPAPPPEPTTPTAATTTHSHYDSSPLPPGFRQHPAKYSDTYLRRGKPLTEAQQQELAQAWPGAFWNWTHPPVTHNNNNNNNNDESSSIPWSQYPNQDVPSTAFPSTAWQVQSAYLEPFLQHSMALVDTALEVILAEYQHSAHDQPNMTLDQRSYMFQVTLIRDTQKERYPKNPPGNAGWATPTFLARLQKRLLHAMLTQGSFHFAMGGHSSACGHGNHFQQSYTLQVQRALEPLLARLGVYHQSFNYGMGGLGTMQNALGATDLYGSDDLDVLVWDSGMTEGAASDKELFARQALLSVRPGAKVPVLWGNPDHELYERNWSAGVIMTGMWGTSFAGLPFTVSESQVQTLPWWSRYMQCQEAMNQACTQTHRYNATCWIDRDDGRLPDTKQMSFPAGRAKWHPGNRAHFLAGRQITFLILAELKKGLQRWQSSPDFILPDEAWHLTEDYEKARREVRKLTDSPCFQLNLPDRVCTLPLQARTEFTPRRNAGETSIRTILAPDMTLPKLEANMYPPPDVYNPIFDPPYGEIDYVNIIENGIDFVPNKARKAAVELLLAKEKEREQRRLAAEQTSLRFAQADPIIPPGQGWSLDTLSAPDNCDGSYDSFCGRSKHSNCVLSGHNDHRGALVFDGLSGWLKLRLPKVQHGLVMLKMDDWLNPGQNTRTSGWTCENSQCGDSNGRRQLGGDAETREAPDLNGRHLAEKCTNFVFEFTFDQGPITSWDHKRWEEEKRQLQRVVTIWVLMDNATYITGEARDVDLAIRVTGKCGRDRVFDLTHVYWA